MGLDWSHHSEIWQVPWQHCCQGTCQISRWCDHSYTLSCSFKTSQDLAVKTSDCLAQEDGYVDDRLIQIFLFKIHDGRYTSMKNSYHLTDCLLADMQKILQNIYLIVNFCNHTLCIFSEIVLGWMSTVASQVSNIGFITMRWLNEGHITTLLQVKIGSGNGWVSSGTKPLFEPLLTNIFHHNMAPLRGNEFNRYLIIKYTG